MKIAGRFFACLLALMALFLVVMGARLIILGGSPYYVLIGLVYLASSALIWRRDIRAVHLVGLALVVTTLWSLWEVGANYWALFPRIFVPLAIVCASLLVFSSARTQQGRRSFFSGVIALVAVLAFFGRGFMDIPIVAANGSSAFKIESADNKPVDWPSYSRDTLGTRFSPFTLINRDNVKKLQLAWTYRTGRDTANPNKVDQNTPLQIGNVLYSCTPENAVHAIDATTGQRKWVFEAKASAIAWARCRGLGYFKDDQAASGQACPTRIIGNTVDGRLFALDAATGVPCSGFGKDGMVDLRAHMGPEGAGFYYQNSAPLVAGDKIVVGGWVADNQGLGEPAGAVRAFDARSGALVWAWDPGNSKVTKEPVDGDTYTLGTPNMWAPASYDPDLGLVYAPMGNGGTDAYNPDRPKESIQYNAAMVALDVQTGRPKWHFQTSHHDLWDYDIPSQPALLDMKNDKGEKVPAILVFTKRGQIFALDRRTGEPISKVEERPVTTQGSVPENIISPTQPYSVDMPVMAEPTPLTEKTTWGATMFDHLLCRISFRSLRYDGDNTPPGLVESISSPGALGGQNWGSASYDAANHRLFVNDIRMAGTHKLLPRAEYDVFAKTHAATPDGHGVAPMTGTPYGVVSGIWMSSLGVPCQQPPYGTVAAIDLDTRKIAWQVPAGTASKLGPWGIALGLPLTPGMPTYAGTSATAGGLVFHAGTQDYFLRAYDAETGEVLWKYALPVGASATPMSYISPVDGRQYVVISVGGAAHSPDVGDYVMAFTLPKDK